MKSIKQINIENRPYYFFSDMINLISLYLIFNNVDVYIECNSIQKNNGDKYLIFASTHKNKEVSKSTQNFRMKLKIKLRQ